MDWCEFIKNPDKINKERNRCIEMAYKEYVKINNDERERRLADLREKAIIDERFIRMTGYNEGERAGLKKGEILGLKQGKIEIAKNMLSENIDIAIITRITGLSKKEINKIK